jgi:hypothetical protein
MKDIKYIKKYIKTMVTGPIKYVQKDAVPGVTIISRQGPHFIGALIYIKLSYC